jgi:hypothetical protein
MKKIIYSIITIILLSLNGYSQTASKKEFFVIYADWDGWGRTSRQCHGFGLCKFNSCTFCCVDGGVIVSCDDKKIVPKSGTIKIDVETNKGFMTINLNPQFSEENDAINKKETLYIDEDLKSDKITLHKGVYVFDSSIGKYGGYSVEANMN